MKSLMFCLALISSSAAFSQVSEKEAEDAITDRQAVFKLISYSFAPLGEMVRGKEFDEEEVVKGLQRLTVLAGMIPEMFEVDTRNISSVPTRAADNIWQNQESFNSVAKDLLDGSSSAINILNQKGEAGLMEALDQLRPHCGSCHDTYRVN